jgi:hypothetical protein
MDITSTCEEMQKFWERRLDERTLRLEARLPLLEVEFPDTLFRRGGRNERALRSSREAELPEVISYFAF